MAESLMNRLGREHFRAFSEPMTAHWGVADPAKAEGSDEHRQKVFATIYGQLANRIRIFLSLPLEKIDRIVLKKKLDDIGKA